MVAVMLRALRAGVPLVWLAGCGYPSFTTTLQGEQVISGAPDGGALTTFSPINQLSGIDLDKNPDFVANKATRAVMVSAKAQHAELQLVSPSTQDFSFLDDVSLVATAGDSESVFATRTGVATLNLPAPTPTLQLDVQDVELSPQLASPAVNVVMRGHGRNPPGDTRVHVSVDVVVQFNPK